MAKFLTTSATTYVLEQLIVKASKRVVLVSPYLQFNKRIKQLIEDRTAQGIQFHIVYGKSKLKPAEKVWLTTTAGIQLYFSKDLHAKCYLNEASCIITSMNLYEFSQVNNDEMGVLLTAKSDKEAFSDATAEALRIIRAAKKESSAPEEIAPPLEETEQPAAEYDKITTSALAKKMKMKTSDLLDSLREGGFVIDDDGFDKLTEKAIAMGCEFRRGRGGYYFLWPKNENFHNAAFRTV